jgi:2-polyprenyl-6-hydroxyphenyl methylase/3-demethylubiquinone-9 3-methyltransferase
MAVTYRMSEHPVEIGLANRFAFGRNWVRFLSSLNEDRIRTAENSLQGMLEVETLKGKRFLDGGCGSGLFSLAARRLGAQVHSFDYDPQCVECGRELKRRYFGDDAAWTIEEGSVLDREYLKALGRFDVVYSWGVLHHTGAMWEALENVADCVAEGGFLFLSIYNDQGGTSRRWRTLKRTYNRSPGMVRGLIVAACLVHSWWRPLLKDLLRGRPGESWSNYWHQRGMSPISDAIDWAGGYPFEVAKPEQIFEFYRDRGFLLKTLKTSGGGMGCNEYVFCRTASAARHLGS